MRLRIALAAVIGSLALPAGASAIPARAVFSYTGSQQSYTVPAGVVMVALAAQGGHGGQYAEGGANGGAVAAMMPVSPGQKLYVEVGSAGSYNGGATFGGGGAAGAPPPVLCMTNGSLCGDVYASSGGGASDVRTCSISAASCPGGVSSAATRLIVGGGGGGAAGFGNADDVTCGANGAGGSASNFRFPGQSGAGPAPIVTAAGIVFPGFPTSDAGQPGVTPAGGGSDVAGAGGAQAGCTAGGGGSITISGSIRGGNAVNGLGGTGGNASSLGPMGDTAGCGSQCQDAGPGGGGGGGYFGGGGGATGLDTFTGECGTCNGAGPGQGGAGGSSFVSKRMMDPSSGEITGGFTANGVAEVLPAIQIQAPVNGAVYTPGQVVDASWSCGFDSVLGYGISDCTATAVSGARIDTSPGTHTFKVSGSVSSNGNHTVSASVTYTARAGGASKVAHGSLAGFKFALSVPSTCTVPTAKLPVTLTKSGSGKGYRLKSFSYYVGRGVPHTKRVNGRKVVVYGPTLVTRHTGTVHLPLTGLKAGSHPLKLVITATATGNRKPSKKTLALKLSFSAC